ncbi:MAG: hypothetical protein K2O38_03040 [Muribaculaceae bacterium]|nr:hypothetical protein [Muribaculaceae bacterium]
MDYFDDELHVLLQLPKQCPVQLPARQPDVLMLCALQVLAQLRVQRPLQVLLQPEPQPEQPLDEPPPFIYGSSISHDVSNDGTVIAAMIGKAADAAFLKKERRLIKFLSIYV